MKNVKLPLLLALASTLVAGCVVTSVYPFYTEADVVFDPALVGAWVSADDPNPTKQTWTFERNGTKEYRLAIRDEEGTKEYEAHLFKLQDQRCLDLRLTERKEGHFPVHFLLKVSQIQPTLQMSGLVPDWLDELLTRDPRAIRHQKVQMDPKDKDNWRLVFTAETSELQDFLRKHLNDPQAFADYGAMKRRENKP